jgi:hypothetical protein
MMGYWNGDEWRWRLKSYGPATISVIERSKEDEAKARERKGRRVPFGFARAIPVVEREPQVWEGED